MPDFPELKLHNNFSRAVAHWANADPGIAPVIEVLIKDSSEFLHVKSVHGSNFGFYQAPTSLQMDNTVGGTMAEAVAIVRHLGKKLGNFVPNPDYIQYSKGPRAGFTVNNIGSSKVPIVATSAFYHNDSSCCYDLQERRSPSQYASEQYEWRLNLDWLRSIGANFLTSDDSDTIEMHALQEKYLDTVSRPTVESTPAAMRSTLYELFLTGMVPDTDRVRLKGWNGGSSESWGGQVCIFSYPGYYLWTARCSYEDPAYTNVFDIKTVGQGHMIIRNPGTGECAYSDPNVSDAVYWRKDCTSRRAHWTRTAEHRFADADGRFISFDWDDRYTHGTPFAYNSLDPNDTSSWSQWLLEPGKL